MDDVVVDQEPTGKPRLLKELAVTEAACRFQAPLLDVRIEAIAGRPTHPLYLFRRTAVLGAVVLTGYLGGAVATHLRVGDPLISHTLFPVYVGTLVWLGLALRNSRVRALAAEII